MTGSAVQCREATTSHQTYWAAYDWAGDSQQLSILLVSTGQPGLSLVSNDIFWIMPTCNCGKFPRFICLHKSRKPRTLNMSVLALHNGFRPPSLMWTSRLLDWIGLGTGSVKIIWNAYQGGKVEMGYHYNLFPAYKGWTHDQLSIRRQHPHKDLKWTKLCLGPI